jgi:hypothetical protein
MLGAYYRVTAILLLCSVGFFCGYQCGFLPEWRARTAEISLAKAIPQQDWSHARTQQEWYHSRNTNFGYT